MERKEYFAFISYKREDVKWATWLQRKLENYRLPSSMNGRTDLPRHIRPVFRDVSELSSGVLAEEIRSALRHSRYLIVICSPNAAQSEWVDREIESFMESGRADRIIPLIVEGTPHADNPAEECYPMALRQLPYEKELLGISVREAGREAAATKVVAHMLGLSFDSLWRREEKRKRRVRLGIAGLSLAVAVAGIAVGTFFMRQNREIRQKDWAILEESALVRLGDIQKLMEKGDYYRARRLAAEILPRDLNNPDRPVVPGAEAALRKAWMWDGTVLREAGSIPFRDVAISPDAKYCAAISDVEVTVWRLRDGRQMWSRPLDTSLNQDIRSVNFSADGKTLEYYRAGYRVTVNTDSWQEVGVEQGTVRTDPRIAGFDSSQDQLYSVRPSMDGSFDLSSLFLPMSPSCRIPSAANVLSFDAAGKRLAIGTHWGHVLIWNISRDEAPVSIAEGLGSIRALAFSPEGDCLAAGGWQSDSLTLWDTKAGTTLYAFSVPDPGVGSIAFSPDRKTLAAGTYDGRILLWNYRDGSPITELPGRGYVLQLAFTPDGERLIAASKEGTVSVWDCRSWQLVQSASGLHYPFAVSPSGTAMVSQEADGSALVELDIPTGTTHPLPSVPEIQQGQYLSGLAFGYGEAYLVALMPDGTVRILDRGTTATVCELRYYRDFSCISVSPDGRSIAVGIGFEVFVFEYLPLQELIDATWDWIGDADLR